MNLLKSHIEGNNVGRKEVFQQIHQVLFCVSNVMFAKL